MANAQVKTLKAFTIRDASTGALVSPAKGSVLEVDSAVATAWIADGLAQEYSLITPTGTKTITENGINIDVAAYAKAIVAVPNPSTGTLEITAEGTYDVTEYASVHVAIAAEGTAPTE